MIYCTGNCSSCGRCDNRLLMTEVNRRKKEDSAYPADFHPDQGAPGFGVAVDIGTTTVVGILWDLNSGEKLGSAARTNPQSRHGMDVITRISYCSRDKEKIREMRQLITSCINEILRELCSDFGIDPGAIRRVTVCGNTTMSHLFAGYDPMSLALAPFRPAYEGPLFLKAEESGLSIRPDAQVILFPNIAGHVGGDVTAGILAARLMDKKKLTAYIDIGTNGEIVLTDGKRICVCSTAAGSAFEGASILCGMRAADGAIEKILIKDGDVFFRTISGKAAQGICGSGIIDAVAQMLDAGLVNRKGRMASAKDIESKGLDPEFRNRLYERNGERCFVVAFRDGQEEIVVTQNDIRQIQLAKAAVAAGLALMLEEMGYSIEDIDELIVAGAFGCYIDKKSAVRIGLLPNIELSRIHVLGNAAGAGVSMALMSQKEWETVLGIPKKAEHIELENKSSFQDVYIRRMAF